MVSTLAGAIVDHRGSIDFPAIAGRFQIIISTASQGWSLVQCDVNLASLGPPTFARELSRELRTTVIAFFLQSAASVEQIEHWENGQLMRKLEYSGDGGGWVTQSGTPQAWEPTYFFAEDEGTVEGAKWPMNLRDELSDEELARYERAKISSDASSVMDLLSGGSVWPIERLCRYFGLDLAKPNAHYTPPTNWKPRIIAAAILAFLLAMILLGALTR